MRTKKNTADGPQGPCRLLDLKQAAAYSGIAYWTLRGLVAEGRIAAVRLPSPGAHDGRPLRRILLDRADVDRFIDQCKEQGRIDW